MADWRSREERDPRLASRQRSRSPPAPSSKHDFYQASTYRPYYDSSSSRRKSATIDPFSDVSSKAPNISVRAGNGSPSSGRGTGDSPGEHRSLDPRRPNRIGSYSENHPSASAAAGAMDSPRDMRRPSAPGRINSTASSHVGSTKKQNDSQFEAKAVEDQFTSIFKRIYDVGTAAAPLMIQKGRSQQKKESEERDAKKYEALTAGFPAAAEQREDQQRKLAESITQNNIELVQNFEMRDQIAKDFGRLVSSLVSPAAEAKIHNAHSDERHHKLFDELEHMSSKLDAKASDKRSLKQIEADLADIKKESKTNTEKLNTLQLKGEEQEKALTDVKDRLKKEEKDAKHQQSRQAQLKIELSQLQIDAKAPKGSPTGLKDVNEEIRGLSTRIAQGLGHVNDKISGLTTRLESHDTVIERLEQGQGSPEKQGVDEQNVKLDAAFDDMKKGLEEANSKFEEFKNVQEEVNKLIKRHEQFSRTPTTAMPEEPDLQSRVAKLEKAIEEMKQDLDKSMTYQLRKENVLFEDIDGMKGSHTTLQKGVENMKAALEKDILVMKATQASLDTVVRQAQSNILENTNRMNKTNAHVERIARSQTPLAFNANASPNPQAHTLANPQTHLQAQAPAQPQQPEPNPALVEVQNKLSKYSTITAQVQQQLNHYLNTVTAMSQAIQALEGRYTTLSTEPIIKSMVQYMQEMYPYASNAQIEIDALKTQVLALQDKPDREELQALQNKINQVEGSFTTLIGRVDDADTRSNIDENKQMERSLKWSEERQDLLNRLDEMKKALEEYQDTCTTELAEQDGRIKVLETPPISNSNHTNDVHETQGSANTNGYSHDHVDVGSESAPSDRERERRKRARLSSARSSDFEVQIPEAKPDLSHAARTEEARAKIVQKFLTDSNRRKRKVGADGDEP